MKTAPPPGIPARYPFHCPRCDNPGQPNDRVCFQRGAYVHVDCASGGDDDD